MDESLYRDVDGVWIHEFFSDEAIRSAINYKPRDGDIFTVTYPKCGTNWMQCIIWNILTHGAPASDIGEFSLMCPYIDLIGAGAAENPSRMGPIMTHLPLSVFRPMSCAKYIYVARNPYDCAVSYYHFLKGLTPKTFTDLSVEKFLSLFLSGKVIYGDYFDHLLPWYERRHDKNVLFLTYEQLKADIRGQVLKIGDFLGEKYGYALRVDKSYLERVVYGSSLENMKALFNVKPEDRMKKIAEAAAAKCPSIEMLKNMPQGNHDMHEGAGFVRKGIVGDWKNYFTPDQIEQMKAWIKKKTQGSDIMSLWEDCDLP
ncbi:hypothetical protein V5799_033068 [Amblyomma americanum]|uniref:Sulfotransferase domain-containing protein n=1 Tax=Amblyomma americanum TaxID=6943 RepID=A0AAQ4DPC7_AMBAM